MLDILLKNFLCLVGYLSQNTFPQPLTEAEEEWYVKKFLAGDTEARDVLIRHNLRLVAHIAKKFDSPQTDADDLISIGTIGLIKGINTFNPDKGAKLATYVARCIENEILMYLRSQKKRKCEVSIHDPVGVDREGNEITLQDILGTENDIVADKVEMSLEYEQTLQKMKVLSAREKDVLIMRFGLDHNKPLTQREIGKKLGISRSYVSRIEKKALEKLRSQYAE